MVELAFPNLNYLLLFEISLPNERILRWDSCPPANNEGFAEQTINVEPDTSVDYAVVSKNFLKPGGTYPRANWTVMPNFYQCSLTLNVSRFW